MHLLKLCLLEKFLDWLTQKYELLKKYLRIKYRKRKRSVYGIWSKLKNKYFTPYSVRDPKINEIEEFRY